MTEQHDNERLIGYYHSGGQAENFVPREIGNRIAREEFRRGFQFGVTTAIVVAIGVAFVAVLVFLA